MSKRCSAKNRNGKRCGAWSAAGLDKCALHSDPELAAKMGSMQLFIPEWDRLTQNVTDEDDQKFLLKVRQMAERCMNQPHIFLRFVGD
jgi:hypothetical protein